MEGGDIRENTEIQRIQRLLLGGGCGSALQAIQRLQGIQEIQRIQRLLLGGGGAIRRGSPLQGIQSLQKIQEIQRLYYWMGGAI